MATARPSSDFPLLPLSEPPDNHSHRGTSFTDNDNHRDEDADTMRERRMFLDTSKWDWRKIFTFITIWLAFILIYAAFSAVGAFFPNRAAEKGSSPAATGVIIGCAPLCVFLFVPVFGYLLPEVKLKYIFSVGVFFVGGAYMILGYALALPSGWIFITVCVLLRSIEGIGSAMFLTAFFSLLPQLYPNHMGIMTGMVEAAVCLGFSIGLPIGGLLYAADGFKLPFLVIGGIHLAFIPPAFLLVQHASFIQQLPSWRNSANLVCNLTVILTVICNIICLAALTFFVPTLSPYLTSQFHLNKVEVSLEFLIAPVVYMPSAVVVGKLSDKLRPRYFIISGAIICGIGYFFVGPAHFITQPVLWLTVVAHGSVGVGAAMGTVPFYSDLLDIGKSLGIREDQGYLTEVAAGVTALSLSFGFIGPFIGGLLMQFMDFPTSALVFGEAALAQGCLLLGATLINRIIQRMELQT